MFAELSIGDIVTIRSEPGSIPDQWNVRIDTKEPHKAFVTRKNPNGFIYSGICMDGPDYDFSLVVREDNYIAVSGTEDRYGHQWFFDWNYCTEDNFRKLQEKLGQKDYSEDDTYGSLYITNGNRSYIVDMRYKYFSEADYGIYMVPYASNEEWYHCALLGCIKHPENGKEVSYKEFQEETKEVLIDFLVPATIIV